MGDALTIGVRFALYVDLMLLFGLPLFALYTPLQRRLFAISPKVLGALALLGLALSVLSIAAMTASMAWVGLAELMLADVEAMIVDTSIGHAWLARVIALMMLAALLSVRPRTGLGVLLAGVALGSLAWTGHGAAGEGASANLLLIGDIVHLFAAAAWLGALVVLSHMVFGSTDVLVAQQALDRFAKAGTVIVATIVATGLSSSAFLIGWSGVAELPETRYGQLLLLKLVLFVVMLALAAMNRFRLTPALLDGEPVTRSKLRRSLALETAAAIAILALVAWLGTLEPPVAAS
ncbi:MAG: copper homeostasis membrane protein CopD [Qipengyuania sp.]|nr:copper homeostasis membrane protein CopD [Qipengyuania sp.]